PVAVNDDAEVMPVEAFEGGLGHPFYEPLRPPPVGNKVRDGSDLETVLSCEDKKIGKPAHAAVVIHDFTDDAGRDEARETRNVHSGFRMPGADKHPAITGDQREYMAGTYNVVATF